MAATSSAYLVAGCSVAQNEESAFGGVRNIFVTSTPAQNFTQSATELRWITSFEDSQPAGASNPYLVKLGRTGCFCSGRPRRSCSSASWMVPENWWGISTMAAADCPIVSR
ncbi:MAG: hypothetical protein ACLSHU_10970 [Oscillospiraceae bacterium]